MQKNILKLINKKVAGRQEGIEKVEGYLSKQDRYNREQKDIEDREKAEKIAELNRLAAEREAKREAEINLYLAQQRMEEEQSEPETPVFRKIQK